MKILALMNSYTQGLSGGDVRFMEIMKRMENIDLTIITSSLGKEICEKKGVNAKYIITTNEKTFENLLLTYSKRIVQAFKFGIKIEDYDILYSSSDFLPDVFPAFFWKLKNKNIKWVSVTHHLYKNPFKRKGNSFLNNLFGLFSQRLGFSLIKANSDIIITVSFFVKNELVNIGFSESKIKINPPGIDIKKINSFKQAKKGYDCVFLGRLNISKGIFDLVKIWKIIIKENSGITLVIIGGGNPQLEVQLKNKIRENELEKNIDVLGYLEDEKVFGIIKSSKIFLLPSHEEGFGISIVEAMGLGKPCIVWNLPIYDSIFKNSLIKIQEGDNESYAKKILHLLKNRSIRNKFSKKAKKEAKRYDWDKIVKTEIKLLRGLKYG